MARSTPTPGRLRRLIRFLLLREPAPRGSWSQSDRDAASHQRLESARIAEDQAGRNNWGMF